MHLIRYIEAVVAGVLLVGSLTTVSVILQQRFLPDWDGATAILARLVVGISVLIGTAELLGLFGLFQTVPLVAALAFTAVATWVRRRNPSVAGIDRIPDDMPAGTRDRREPWWERVGALLSVGVVLAEWGPGTIDSYRRGMTTVDTLWYHLPFAAHFAQTGSIISLQNIDNDNVIAFYPASSEVVHSIGIELMGNDLLSPLINLGWLGLALLSAWCLGRRFGVPSLVLMAVTVMLGSTELVADEPGSAYSDIAGMALLLAALAFLALAGQSQSAFLALAGQSQSDGLGGPTVRWTDRPGVRLAALAAGGAVGVKYTFLFPVGAMTACVIILSPAGRRTREGLIWCLLATATGGVWYVRNFIDTGNPLPNVHIGVGSVRLPTLPGAIGFPLSHFLSSGNVWSTYIWPGLGQALGPAYLPILVLAALGLALGLIDGRHRLTRSSPLRIVAVVGWSTVVGYLVTPQPNLPSSFVYDLRFAVPGLALGLIALPIACRHTRWVTLFTIVFGGLLAATQFGRSIWSAGGGLVAYHSVPEGLAVGLSFLAVGGAILLVRNILSNRFRPTRKSAVAIIVLAALALGFPVQQYYLDHRYASGAQASIVHWANSVDHAQIALSGLILHYPLYGDDLTNSVTFVGAHGAHDAFAPIADCRDWRRAINAGRFKYVVTAGNPDKLGHSPADWTRTDPAARQVASARSLVINGYLRTDVFRLAGPLNPGGCGSA